MTSQSRSSLPTCDACGVALDGHVRKAHTVVVLHDGRMVHGANYCAEHAGELVDGYRHARQDVAGELDALRRYGAVAGEGVTR